MLIFSRFCSESVVNDSVTVNCFVISSLRGQTFTFKYCSLQFKYIKLQEAYYNVALPVSRPFFRAFISRPFFRAFFSRPFFRALFFAPFFFVPFFSRYFFAPFFSRPFFRAKMGGKRREEKTRLSRYNHFFILLAGSVSMKLIFNATSVPLLTRRVNVRNIA